MLKISSNENSQGKKGGKKGDRLLFLCGLSLYKVFDASSSGRKEKCCLFSFGKSSLSPFSLFQKAIVKKISF